ncbi:MAG TPA: sugar ABC transporter substrate-binding protein [Archaeoglobus sp.]|nr:sugar ABC transporter substrate-binding protein [Archaeoglobus sp.]
MKRRFVIILILLVLEILLLGKTIKIGFIATNFAAESQARVANAFEKLAKEKNWKVIMLNSQGSIERQANQLENLVQMGVDAIVMAMGHPREIKPALDKAFKAGIPVITIDSGYVEGVVADITCDNFVMGAKISTYLVDSLGGEGNIVVFKFEKHFGTRRRGKVLDVVLSEYPGIKVLAEYTVAATKRFMEDTRSAMETYAIRFGDKIDAVWCAFDQLAYAVGDVVQQYNLKNVLITGVDGNEETFRRIKAGLMTATIAQPFEEMAEKAVELIEKIVVEKMPIEEAAPRKIIYLDAPLIDKYNLPNK